MASNGSDSPASTTVTHDRTNSQQALEITKRIVASLSCPRVSPPARVRYLDYLLGLLHVPDIGRNAHNMAMSAVIDLVAIGAISETRHNCGVSIILIDLSQDILPKRIRDKAIATLEHLEVPLPSRPLTLPAKYTTDLGTVVHQMETYTEAAYEASAAASREEDAMAQGGTIDTEDERNNRARSLIIDYQYHGELPPEARVPNRAIQTLLKHGAVLSRQKVDVPSSFTKDTKQKISKVRKVGVDTADKQVSEPKANLVNIKGKGKSVPEKDTLSTTLTDIWLLCREHLEREKGGHKDKTKGKEVCR